MKRVRLALLAAAATAPTGCLLQPDTASCASYGDCETCTARPNCGWCGDRGCVSGTSRAPSGRRCPDYRWDGCDVDPCRLHTTSAGCRSALDCAWCTEEQFCTTDEAECSARNPCRTVERCDDCAALGCGWCQDGRTGACHPERSECHSGGIWRAQAESCPTPCETARCDDCLAMPYECEYATRVLGAIRDPARCRFSDDLGTCRLRSD